MTAARLVNARTSPKIVASAHVLDLTGLLLLMTVNPGFGGQRYLASMEPKITAARHLIDHAPHPVELEVIARAASPDPAVAGRPGRPAGR